MDKRNNFNNDIEKVICYEDKLLKDIKLKKLDESNIDEVEKILTQNGYNLPEKNTKQTKEDRVIKILSWENLLNKANSEILDDNYLNGMFSKEELKQQKEVIKIYEKEFNQIHKLDNYDIAIAAFSGIIGAIVDIVLVGIPHSSPDGLKAGTLSNRVRNFFANKFPEEEMEKLANSKISKVPYDAQDNRNTEIYVDGLSAYYHRMLQLGHDPFLGLIFGTLDVLNGTMTTIDKKGKIVVQTISEYQKRKEEDIYLAITKQFIHFASDITTSMGLPAPLMSLFNLLQIGKIGENEQTIAEIVQGMYYEGYDFIHFCSMSIPVMITEIITRLCYTLKKIKEGKTIKNSIPFSLNREKNPKLATMLFLSHSTSSAINAGKVYFTHNPMAINYPEWLAFFKYSYKQLKWVIIEKPELRERYITNKLDGELYDVFDEINNQFDVFTKDAIIIME